MQRNKTEYRIIGAYDSETCNVNGKQGIFAYPVLHQLGLLDCPIDAVNAVNVEQHTRIHLYRHTVDLYAKLDEIAGADFGYVPVIACHNLAFDMYALSPYLSGRDVRVTAKSCRKPMVFSILGDDGKPCLAFWDTLLFSQQGLKRMGEDCGYCKAVGEWDYELIRTPDTPLTDEETDYACKDVYALLAWLGWWIERNPDIDSSKLGHTVITKTGVVRERRKVRFGSVRGKNRKYTVSKYWIYLNDSQKPKTDDELYHMSSATRGGYTFVAMHHASKVYELEGQPFSVLGFDAASMHPAQMVSHKVPVDFTPATPKTLESIFALIGKRETAWILEHWAKPFLFACYACFEFENIRPRSGSLYERHGIYPLASTRFESCPFELNENNQDNQQFRETNPCKDSAVNPVYAFGKLVSADRVRIYLTELGIWEVWQSYEWDSVQPVSGYVSSRFVRPSDMAVISVMRFYRAKNIFKRYRSEYKRNGFVADRAELETIGIPDFVIDGMANGTIDIADVDNVYMSLKADLNSLYGIEASNEYRRDTVLTSSGIEYTGENGIQNAPKHCKAHYQYGQRIVGWSRVVQHIALQLLDPFAIDIVTGDTDSIKAVVPDVCKHDAVDCFAPLGRAIDSGKAIVTQRVKESYPDLYDDLSGIGWYEYEFETDNFCAAWNKAYAHMEDGRIDFTIAGIPTGNISALAEKLYAQGMPFGGICDEFLGYNVTYSYDLLHLHSRAFPEWGDIVSTDITDYRGIKSHVVEPASLALFPMAKTANDTSKFEHRGNIAYAIANRPTLDDEPRIITNRGIYGTEMVRQVL